MNVIPIQLTSISIRSYEYNTISGNNVILAE